MSQTELEVCSELQKTFAQKHIDTIRTMKTTVNVATPLDPKSMGNEKNKPQKRIKGSRNILDMLQGKKPSKKKRKVSKKIPVPQKRKRSPPPKPKPVPKSSDTDSDVDAPPQKRKEYDSDLEDLLAESDEDNIFERQRKRRKIRSPPSPPDNTGSKTLREWEGLLEWQNTQRLAFYSIGLKIPLDNCPKNPIHLESVYVANRIKFNYSNHSCSELISMKLRHKTMFHFSSFFTFPTQIPVF